MKKIYSFVMVSIIALTANAQVALIENFSGFTTGNLNTQGGWVTTSGSPDVQVANSTPLIYPGYTSGTEYITVSQSNGKEPHRKFQSNINTSTNPYVYMSFVVRASAAEQTDQGPDYSLSLYDTVAAVSTARPLRFYIGQDPNNSTHVQFGITTGSSNTVSWTNTNLNLLKNTTYLILIRYDVNSGSDNDNAYLWVNPNLNTEPTTGSANASTTGAGEVNFGNLLTALRVVMSSNSKSPAAAYDAFRVAGGASSLIAWTNLSPAGATLPVVLTSFNAANEGLSTKLVWNTTDESGIANYVIEKSNDGRSFTAIGTIKATNQKAYSFSDGSTGDNSYYRLKMVDINGAFKYSYVVSIKSKLNANISLSPNPVTNNLMVQHPKFTTESHIQIVSVNGQLLKDVKVASNAVISNIDMSGFTNGLYHIVFRSGSDKFTKTVIKQ
jgi:hypothetical protein